MPEKPEQTFTFDTMAAVLCCMLHSGVNLGIKHFKMMSAMDGTRSDSSIEHQFRSVKARAKQLHESSDFDEPFTPNKRTQRKGSKTSTPGSRKKCGLQAASEHPSEKDEDAKSDEDSSSAKTVKEEVVEDADYEV